MPIFMHKGTLCAGVDVETNLDNRVKGGSEMEIDIIGFKVYVIGERYVATGAADDCERRLFAGIVGLSPYNRERELELGRGYGGPD